MDSQYSVRPSKSSILDSRSVSERHTSNDNHLQVAGLEVTLDSSVLLIIGQGLVVRHAVVVVVFFLAIVMNLVGHGEELEGGGRRGKRSRRKGVEGVSMKM